MFELAQKKLREAKFCFAVLEKARQQVVRNQPEEVEFHLSAFLSAARAVTWALAYEETEKYNTWKDGWFARQSEEDRRLLKFMVEQRNYVQKRGKAETTSGREYIPVINVITAERSHPAYGFHFAAPPGTPPPEVGRTVHVFEEWTGDEKEITGLCRRYLDILDRLLKDFAAEKFPPGAK